MNDSIASLAMTNAHLLDWFHVDYMALKSKVSEETLLADVRLKEVLAEKHRTQLRAFANPRNLCHLQVFRKRLREAIAYVSSLLPQSPITLEDMFVEQRLKPFLQGAKQGQLTTPKRKAKRA